MQTLTEVAPTLTPPTAPRRSIRPSLLRLHFYVGVFVAPFLLVSAITGLLFAFAPQLDRFAYRHELTVPVHGARLSLATQLIAARQEHPEGTVAAVVPPAHAHDTTQFVLSSVPGIGAAQRRTVYVDPYTGRVRGALTTNMFGNRPVSAWLGEFHRSLQLGPIGRIYSETAASWLWVLATGGLVLWLRRTRRSRRLKRILLPDRAATGRRRTLSWHGATGIWICAGMFFIAATGLTWSQYAGAHFDSALTAFHAHAPDISTNLPASSPAWRQPIDPTEADDILRTARKTGLRDPLELDVPANVGKAWTVKETGRSWPLQRDSITVDPATKAVVKRNRYADWPLLAKLSQLGISAHEGYLFGLPNQIALALFAGGIIVMLGTGYRSWWQRRSTFSFGRPPTRGGWRRVHPAVLIALSVVALGIGIALPVFGVELAGFLLVDLLIGAIVSRFACTIDA